MLYNALLRKCLIFLSDCSKVSYSAAYPYCLDEHHLLNMQSPDNATLEQGGMCVSVVRWPQRPFRRYTLGLRQVVRLSLSCIWTIDVLLTCCLARRNQIQGQQEVWRLPQALVERICSHRQSYLGDIVLETTLTHMPPLAYRSFGCPDHDLQHHLDHCDNVDHHCYLLFPHVHV